MTIDNKGLAIPLRVRLVSAEESARLQQLQAARTYVPSRGFLTDTPTLTPSDVDRYAAGPPMAVPLKTPNE